MQQLFIDNRVSSRRSAREGGRRAIDRPVSASTRPVCPWLRAKQHDPGRRSGRRVVVRLRLLR